MIPETPAKLVNPDAGGAGRPRRKHASERSTPPAPLPPVVIDCHVHLVGHGRFGSHVAPSYQNGWAFWYFRQALGLRTRQPHDLSDAYRQRLRQLLDQSPEITAVVLLGLDARYDESGHRDLADTALYVSNDDVLDACAQDSRCLPGCSINPRRRDAIDELVRVAEAGAVCIKVLPNSQNFDPNDRDFVPFYQKMAELGLPLLAHTGREHTLPVASQAYGYPVRHLLALDAGVTLIAAHTATAGWLPMVETLEQFEDMIPMYDRLYGDMSALSNVSRAQYFGQLRRNPAIVDRWLYGSDFPVPSWPLLFARRLGLSRALHIHHHSNLLNRHLKLCQAFNIDPAVYYRAVHILRLTSRQRASLNLEPKR